MHHVESIQSRESGAIKKSQHDLDYDSRHTLMFFTARVTTGDAATITTVKSRPVSLSLGFPLDSV